MTEAGPGVFEISCTAGAQAKCIRFGYRPWVTYGPRYRDPLFGYYRWHNRGNPAWQRTLMATYRGRVAGTRVTRIPAAGCPAGRSPGSSSPPRTTCWMSTSATSG